MCLILGLINLVTDKYNFQKVEKQIDSPYNFFLQKEKRWYLGFGVSTFEQSNMEKFSLLEPLERLKLVLLKDWNWYFAQD